MLAAARGNASEMTLLLVRSRRDGVTSQLSATTALIGEGVQRSSQGSSRPMTLVAYRLRRLPE
jgi:hypothetical protein